MHRPPSICGKEKEKENNEQLLASPFLPGITALQHNLFVFDSDDDDGGDVFCTWEHGT